MKKIKKMTMGDVIVTIAMCALTIAFLASPMASLFALPIIGAWVTWAVSYELI